MEQHLPGGFINAVVRVGDTVLWWQDRTWVTTHRATLEAALS